MSATIRFEYKVVPAPRRGEKAPGARTTPERFAGVLTRVINDLARDGWEYLRADTLPCDERAGLTGTATHFQNMLVFRRALPGPAPLLLVDPTSPVARATDVVSAAPAPAAVLVAIPGAEGPAPALGPATHPDGPAN